MTDWLKIRKAYEVSDETVACICKRFAVTSGALYKQAKKQNWQLRRKPQGGKSGTVKTRKNAQPVLSGKNKVDRKQLIDRLYNAFEKQMSDFETQRAFMVDEGISEKDARTLGSLARTLEKLIELKNEEEGETTLDEKEVNIERLREKLTQRLERLRLQRGT